MYAPLHLWGNQLGGNFMGIKVQTYIKESQAVIQVLQKEKAKCEKVETCYYDNYISDSKNHRNFMKRIFQTKGSKLLVAGTGAGKSTALIDSANRFLEEERNTKVIIVAPTRGLAEQMGNHDTVSCIIGGVDYNENDKLISTTYDKLNHLLDLFKMEQRKSGYQYILIADEAHLMVTQAEWKKYPIRNLLDSLEGDLFSNVLFVTATPEPLTAFNFDKIIEFKNKSTNPSIDKVEIILVEDGMEYLKQIPFEEEFPFVRLCHKNYMDSFIEENSYIKAVKLTADEKQGKLYQDIVEKGVIDRTDMDMIFTTNLLEAGVSICQYPEEIVPIALFIDHNISVDNIIQFLSRLRRTEKSHVKTARVVIKKGKEKEIQVSLMQKDSILIEFQKFHFQMGNLKIQDTFLMNGLMDGTYKLKIIIGNHIQYRNVKITSSGDSFHGCYAKDNKELVFEHVSFKSLIYLLTANKERVERMQENIQQKMDALNENRKWMNLNVVMTKIERQKDEELIRSMARAAIDNTGEFKLCLSYINGKIEIDNNIFFMLTYEQFQRQYSNPLNVDILQKELADKMDTIVEVKVIDTKKGRHPNYNVNDIWEEIEEIKNYIGISNLHYHAIFGEANNIILKVEKEREKIYKIRAQKHLMELLMELRRAGVEGETALKILVNSKSKSDVTQYKNLCKIIRNNMFLERIGSSELDDISFANENARNRLQAVCYCYLKKKGNKSSYTINETLIMEIIDSYNQHFPKSMKKPTKRKVKDMIKKMYRIKEVRKQKIMIA